MCAGCLEKDHAASALPATDEMLAAVEAIRALYEMPDCEAGGPLHVIVDDFNVEDDLLEPYVGQREWQPGVLDQAEKILVLLRPMTIPQRSAVIGLTHGYFD